MTTMISVENVSKFYRLGTIGGGTLRGDVQRWWARMRGKENPLLKIGETDHRNRDGKFIWALRNVNFEVKQGEVLGIIGRNGAGKSTLLKILSRVTAPTSGEIKVDGRIASLLEVGTGFHPELTGRENIYLNGAILGMNRREISRKFDEIVEFAEVGQFIDTPVKRYSSGMYVRLAFAVAAHLDPEILIVDEVLAVGDAAFQKKCLGKMGDVAKEGRTVLFVSHNMGAIRNLCSTAVCLEHGMISNRGNTNDVVSEYLAKTMPHKISKNPVLIKDDMREHKGGDVRITNVGLQKKSGEISQDFAVWENIYISLDVQNYLGQSVSINCWFSVVTGEDEIIGTSIQYDSLPENMSILPLSRLKINAELMDNILSPGIYFLHVGVLGKNHKILDWCKNVISFQVLPVFKNQSQYDDRFGKFPIRSGWSVING